MPLNLPNPVVMQPNATANFQPEQTSDADFSNDLQAPQPQAPSQNAVVGLGGQPSDPTANAPVQRQPQVSVARHVLDALGGSGQKPGDWAKSVVAGALTSMAAVGNVGEVPQGAGALYGIGKGMQYEQKQAQTQKQQQFENANKSREENRADQEAADKSKQSIAMTKYYEMQTADTAFKLSQLKHIGEEDDLARSQNFVDDAKKRGLKTWDVPGITDLHQFADPAFKAAHPEDADVIDKYTKGEVEIAPHYVRDASGNVVIQGITARETPGKDWMQSTLSADDPALKNSADYNAGTKSFKILAVDDDPTKPAKVAYEVPVNSLTGAQLGTLSAQNDKVRMDRSTAIKNERDRAAGRAAAMAPYQSFVAYNTQSGKREVVTGADIAQNPSAFQQPAKVGAKDLEGFRHDTSVLNDMQRKANDVNSNVAALDQDTVQRGIISQAISDQKNSTMEKLFSAGVLKGATPQTVNYIQSVLSLRESSMALPKLLTNSGRTSETQLNALQATIPGVGPDSKYATSQMSRFQQNIDALRQGVPGIQGVDSMGSNVPANAVPGRAANGAIVYKWPNGQVKDTLGNVYDPATGQPTSR